MSTYLVLLSTDHCALCDEAMTLLFSMPELAGMELRVVDVSNDDLLLERYGAQIPVLQFWLDECAELELFWPFAPDAVSSGIRRFVSL